MSTTTATTTTVLPLTQNRKPVRRLSVDDDSGNRSVFPRWNIARTVVGHYCYYYFHFVFFFPVPRRRVMRDAVVHTTISYRSDERRQTTRRRRSRPADSRARDPRRTTNALPPRKSVISPSRKKTFTRRASRHYSTGRKSMVMYL